MTIQKARPYILSFLKTFVLFGIIKFLMDKYVFNQEFELYELLFMATWMGVILTWWNHRQRKKAGTTAGS